jgi:predicted ArsR family transcriptional regulator
MYGPSTATRLAERMGLTSGATSYHLRQLAAAGFVAEDPERGNARERWWRSVHRSTWFNDRELAEQEPEATLAYLQSIAAAHTLHAGRAVNEYQTMPRPWRDVIDLSDWSLRLTPDEAKSLKEELWSVITRYRQDTPEAAADAPAGAERVTLTTHVLPDLDVPPAGQK